MKYNQNTIGYSLIEVMIAVAILMMAIVAPMTIAIKSIQSSRHTLEQNTATFLAQEAVSMVEALRNHYALESIVDDTGEYWDWTTEFGGCETTTGCNFDARDPYTLIDHTSNIVPCTEDGDNCRLYYNPTARSAYRVDPDSGEATPFIRRIYFDNVSDRELTVRVEVAWDAVFLGQEQQVSLSSSLFNLYGEF